MAPMSAGREFYEAQLDFLQRRDVDGLLEAHYWADAVLVTPERVVTGHQALRAYFQSYLETLGELRVESVDVFSEAPGAILFEATISSRLGRARVYDAFALRDGRVTHHFAGVIRRL
jgi:ketosteroid isomerase-like protein